LRDGRVEIPLRLLSDLIRCLTTQPLRRPNTLVSAASLCQCDLVAKQRRLVLTGDQGIYQRDVYTESVGYATWTNSIGIKFGDESNLFRFGEMALS
jgi:hypothetical protein